MGERERGVSAPAAGTTDSSGAAGRALAGMELPARVLRLLLRNNVRGGWRLASLLSRQVASLHRVPIAIEDWPPIFMDLRVAATAEWLIGSPWAASPHEPDEQAVMRRLVSPGDVVLDIGANLGLHTALLSRLVGPGGRVFAFEPSAGVLPCLRRSVAGMANATLLELALSDEEGAASLYVHPDHPTMTSLGDWTRRWDAGAQTYTVACTRRRLDDLVAAGEVARPDFVKVDVEGAEALVFRGARRTLDREDAPCLLFEENRGACAALGHAISAAREWLGALSAPGYHFFEVTAGGALAPLDRDRLDRPDAPPLRNVVGVPEGRRSALGARLSARARQ